MGLLGKLTGADAAKKQAKDARKQAALRESSALAQLSPEMIQQLMQVFFSKYMGMLAPSMMQSQQRLGAGASGVGLGNAGLTRSLKAGIPALYAGKAAELSTEPAMQTAQQKADVIMGRPIVANPARNGLTDLVDLALQYYSAGGMSTGSTKQQARQF